MSNSDRPRAAHDFGIAIICALPIEADAVIGMFEISYGDEVSYTRASGDENAYTIGRIGRHDVVVVHLPNMGNVSSAQAAADLRLTFHHIQLCLVVGVCGGVPKRGPDGRLEIRLGDVVISTGVVQSGFGRQLSGGLIIKDTLEDSLGRPNCAIRAHVQRSRCQENRQLLLDKTATNLEKLLRRDEFHASRRPDASTETKIGETKYSSIHFGRIASSDVVMKSEEIRNRVAAEQQVIAFEMEGAGVWERFPTVIVKGVCDYADASKTKEWQKYASACAAACMTAFLHDWSVYRFKHTHGQPDTTKPSGNVHFRVPRTVNRLFTGRDREINEILEAFSSPETSHGGYRKTFVISGPGGQGKSEICLKIADILREKFWGIFWVDISTPLVAEAAFIAIAKTLDSTTNGPGLDEARQTLGSTAKTWLLILDNADESEFDYSVYMPPGTRGTIILTTRNSDCERLNTVGCRRLEGLDTASSIVLLFKAANISEGSDSQRPYARRITELLGSHVLALIQAGAYIASGYCTLQEYPDVFRRHRTRLLQFRPGQEQSRYGHVHATFEASTDVLSRSGQAGADALQILGILSKLHHSPFPCDIFRLAWLSSKVFANDDTDSSRHGGDSDLSPTASSAHTSSKRSRLWDSRIFQKIFARGARQSSIRKMQPNPPPASGAIEFDRSHVSQLPQFLPMASKKWDPFRLGRGVKLLASLSLITVTRDQSVALSMHPLAHAWAQDRQKLEEEATSWTFTGCILSLSMFGSHDFWADHRMQLRAHLLAFLNTKTRLAFSASSEMPLLPVLYFCALQLGEMDETDRLQRLLEDVFSMLSLDPDGPVEGYLSLYELQAQSMQSNGQHPRAIRLLEQIREVKKKTLCERSRSLHCTEDLLARAYLFDGQKDRGIELLEQVVQREKASLPETHGALLSTQQALATAYAIDGQTARAIELLEHVAKMKEHLAETNPNRFISQMVLAAVYANDGQRARAIELFEHVVNITSTLAETHPHPLRSQIELAQASWTDGRRISAILQMTTIVQIGRTSLSETHPSRIRSEAMLQLMREKAEVLLCMADET